MQFSQIHHCSIAVQDLDRAAAFYRDVLGLLEIVIPSTFPAAGLNVRWFQVGDQQIHLVLEAKIHSRSQRHVALHVDDAQAARTSLREKGIGIEETVLIPGADRFFITDLDGNRIEIIQWHEAYSAIPVNQPPSH